MRKINLLILVILILSLGLTLPVSAANSTLFPIGAPSAPIVDVINSTYMQDWIYYMIVENQTSMIWEFPILGFTFDLMKPFTDSFTGLGGGNIVYLILWGLFIMMVWRNSGKVTMPAMIAAITAGAMSLLIPEQSQPWCLILLAAAIASQTLTFFAKE
jgi:hypothetical protein